MNSEYKDDLEVTLIADTIPQLKTEGQLKVDTLIGEGSQSIQRSM